MGKEQAIDFLRNVEKVLDDMVARDIVLRDDTDVTLYFVNCPPEKQERFIGLAERLLREKKTDRPAKPSLSLPLRKRSS